ncbi:SDR family oxidoreductase [Tenacibaculum sp. AHE15PA]|uniref:SDR family NAD(P)-dependent oxidoreductase n=1 Tax=unclassified Tenacibaculum TaxID=2635139 RepID=UPI001C4F1930|nr:MULTISPECIES: SDR family oxidoreductase [unclassified Tenacibaculum]QXP72781.1 SDR family oxidoreductase [Tenacibaculum sp. AHE14PA]QXP76695.1 SDR family oxidoreductase [Tenacibaculum sp. AHE15PA]
MKTILVVGGSKGIGKSLVDVLKDTHKIINISRNEIEAHENITHYSLDVLNDELPDLETINGLVYCPGSINLKPIGRLKLDDFREDFEINVVAAVKIIQKYINPLKNNNGSVVLFSTVATKMGMPFHASVSASKSAVEGVVKSLAAEFATKIRFNCIAPTVTDTTLAERLLRNEKQREGMKQRHPLQKILEPTEVASLAAYLLSDVASSISGQVFPIDAGIVSLKL